MTKSDSALTVAAKSITVALTQADTLKFLQGYTGDAVNVEIQANWTYSGGKRAASEVAVYPFSKQLLNEVVS